MSGHSKWNNIKRKKEKTDGARAKVFTKIGREIAVAVKEGGANPASNSKLAALIAKAKAAGKKVYLGTITPFLGNGYYTHFSEAARLTLNDWIRANKDVDGILDFDQVVRDPKEPRQLLKPYSDDGLHGTPAAYEAMGRYAVTVVK